MALDPFAPHSFILADVMEGTRDPGDVLGTPAVRLASRTGRAVVAAAVLGTALAYMSDGMLNVAIPSVAADLGGTVTDIQWVVNSYYVMLVALVLVVGSIGDILGHRRLFLAGMRVFTGGPWCARSPQRWEC